MSKLGFPTGRDSATFRDSRTGNFFFPSLSRDKGTAGQAQNLATGRDGPGEPKFGTGRAGTAKIRAGTRDKTRQSRRGRSKIGKQCSKTEKVVLKQENDVLKQENDVQKQEIWSFFEIFKIHFVPGRPGTEEFVPGHLLLPLSRDKGTLGQEFFLSRDKGTTGRPAGRPVPWKL